MIRTVMGGHALCRSKTRGKSTQRIGYAAEPNLLDRLEPSKSRYRAPTGFGCAYAPKTERCAPLTRLRGNIAVMTLHSASSSSRSASAVLGRTKNAPVRSPPAPCKGRRTCLKPYPGRRCGDSGNMRRASPPGRRDRHRATCGRTGAGWRRHELADKTEAAHSPVCGLPRPSTRKGCWTRTSCTACGSAGRF
jgi:hypothetical protein